MEKGGGTSTQLGAQPFSVHIAIVSWSRGAITRSEITMGASLERGAPGGGLTCSFKALVVSFWNETAFEG